MRALVRKSARCQFQPAKVHHFRAGGFADRKRRRAVAARRTRPEPPGLRAGVVAERSVLEPGRVAVEFGEVQWIRV